MGCKKIMIPTYICQHCGQGGELWSRSCRHLEVAIIQGRNGESIASCAHMFPLTGSCQCVKAHRMADRDYEENNRQLKLFDRVEGK
jgi:hypothetical protein